MLRIAGEFQGFARSLHDEAVDQVADRTKRVDQALGDSLRRVMTTGRLLDRGNPAPEALRRDFSMLGMHLWDELRAKFPRRAPEAQRQILLMLDARNGIAHSDERRIASVQAQGYPLSHLRTVERWNDWTERLCFMMDTCVGLYIARAFGGDDPW